MADYDIYDLLETLPHRYPFLLVDRILEVNLHQSISTLKNVSVNEPFFQGHFPGQPVMPGVIIIESMAQSAGFLAIKSRPPEEVENCTFFLAGVDNVRFKSVVEPGDQLRMDIEVIRMRRDFSRFRATASVEGKVVCSAEIFLAKKSTTNEASANTDSSETLKGSNTSLNNQTPVAEESLK